MPKYLKFSLVWKAFMYETKNISGVQCVYLSTEKVTLNLYIVGRTRSIVRNKSDNRLLEIRVTMD